MTSDGPGLVAAVSRDSEHRFSKPVVAEIMLIADFGVEGDAHAAATVKHRSRVARDATRPNLRQVHLIAAELHDDLATLGFEVDAGQLGENVTTRGLDLLSLPRGTLLHLGATAVVEVTGLRNPCRQIDEFRPGLLKQVIWREPDGTTVRRVGIMGVVRHGGPVRAGDRIEVRLPAPPLLPLEVV